MDDVWKLYVDTVFTNIEDIERYMRINPEATHDGYVQARLRELRGEAGTFPNSEEWSKQPLQMAYSIKSCNYMQVSMLL